MLEDMFVWGIRFILMYTCFNINHKLEYTKIVSKKLKKNVKGYVLMLLIYIKNTISSNYKKFCFAKFLFKNFTKGGELFKFVSSLFLI